MSSTPDREPSTDESLFGSPPPSPSPPSPSPPSREPTTDESASGSPEPQSPILSEGTTDKMLESFRSVQESVVRDLADGKSPEMDFGVENWAPNQEVRDAFKLQIEIVKAVYARIQKPEKDRNHKKLKDEIEPQFELQDTVNGIRIRKAKPKTFGQLREDHQNVARIQGQRFVAEGQARRDKRKREGAERLEAARDASKRARTWQNGFLPNTQPQSQPTSFQQSQPMPIQQSQPMYYHQSQPMPIQQSQPMYYRQSQLTSFQHSQPTTFQHSQPTHFQQSQQMHLQQSRPLPIQQRQRALFQQGQPMYAPSFEVGNAQNIPDGVFDNGVFNDGFFDDTLFDGTDGLN
ncbi:hypothetical protein FVEN_g4833 [Fusarium venenatum]|uniref:Uncharacterized protein n=1 Tax=Fusarium venenatum TaxID=56646 RepID=A0A2L2ST80_9HYPO|nr:uncharacterized protein FVRRES_11296 [Fusarium venenatum]KAG8357600.1 hypothetical protein FVEN_g4833 [Fusarium venenatum]KAH6978010.1 hypothetical protein EDB82DRAFT_557501 [Fusarium venenatum]CEI38605.1 unnamed protein product [Fusarium venenatum]